MNSHGERRSRSKSQGRFRAYLYGSSHDVLQTSSDDDEARTGIAGAARDVRKRISRTGSSITSLHTAKASATRLSNSSSSGLLSTHSTGSQGMDLGESAMIAEQIKQRAYHDGLAAQYHVFTPADEDKHVDSIMAPLRRKSLYTPGIATRNASDILQKPPKPIVDCDYYYDTSRPETSPLSQIAALSVGEDGRSTPCDLHYLQLGGLQLGTLRIMNGAGSPVPSNQPPNLASRSATPESKINDEFYTAPEGSVAEDGKHATPPTPRGEISLTYESRLEDDIRTDNQVPSRPENPMFERKSFNESLPFDAQKADQTARFERWATPSDILHLAMGTSNKSFPFKKEITEPCPIKAMEPSNLPACEKETSIRAAPGENESSDGMKHFEAKRSKVPLPFAVTSHNGHYVDWGAVDPPFSSKNKIHHEIPNSERTQLSEVSPKNTTTKPSFVGVKSPGEWVPVTETPTNGASEIADEYIAELNDNPFSCSSLEVLKDVKAKSQGSTREKRRSNINDAEVQHNSYGNGSREDAFRKLTVNGNTPLTRKAERLSVPPFQTSRHSAPTEMPRTKSGYLTGVPADDVCFNWRDSPIPPTKLTALPQSHALDIVRFSTRSSFRVPLRKLRKQRPKSQPPPSNLITGYHELADACIPRIPSVIAARHANRLSHFPLLEHTFPSSQHTTANEAFSPVQAHDASIRFPSPANASEAAPTSLESYPTASSRPRARTFSINEDDWGASDLVRSPSWSEFGGGRRRKEQKKLAKEEKGIEKRRLNEEKERQRRLQKDRKEFKKQISKEESKQSSTRPRSVSRTRARSSEGQSRRDALATIADFGTVTDCLGNSPYDIATPTFLNPQIARNWPPHQISTAMPRSNSSFSVGTRSQSTFLDMPSVPAVAAVDLKAHNLEWVRNRQRGQNSSVAPAEFSNACVAIPKEVIRPNNEVMPLVPALPTANLVQRREAEIIKSRPQTCMIAEMPVPDPALREVGGQIEVPGSEESGTSARPRKTKGSTIIPNLWSHGSLEKKCTKTDQGSRQASSSPLSDNDQAIPAGNNIWETHSIVWSQRRKSAGEALLRNQIRDILGSQEAANPALLCGHNDGHTRLANTSTSEAHQVSVITPSHLGPLGNSLASHSPSTAHQPTSTSNTSGPLNQCITQQVQRHSCSPLTSLQEPSVSSLEHASQPQNCKPSHTRTKSFQIQRKRVGSGPSLIRAETGIGSSRSEGVLV